MITTSDRKLFHRLCFVYLIPLKNVAAADRVTIKRTLKIEDSWNNERRFTPKPHKWLTKSHQTLPACSTCKKHSSHREKWNTHVELLTKRDSGDIIIIYQKLMNSQWRCDREGIFCLYFMLCQGFVFLNPLSWFQFNCIALVGAKGFQWMKQCSSREKKVSLITTNTYNWKPKRVHQES